MHMPPPVHGAAVVGKQIYDSQLIRDTFDCSFVNYSTSGSLAEIGRFSLKKIVTVFDFIRQVRKRIRNEQPQIVYITPSLSGWAFYRDYLMMRMLKRQKCQVIAHFHNKPPVRLTQKWYNKCLYRRFFHGIHTIFLANCLMEPFKGYIPLKHVHICPNGMPDVATNTEVIRQKIRPYTFLFLSNMMEEKGVIILLQACALLKQRGCRFVCNFIGQWSDVTEPRFNALCTELGLSNNVHAYGGVYGAEKNVYFQQSDAFVFPTFYPAECLSLVVLEAMQHALPIITTDEGALPEVVDGGCGVVVPRQDNYALADKMQYLIEHPDVGCAMGKQGRLKYEQEYTLMTFEHRLTGILENVIKLISNENNCHVL